MKIQKRAYTHTVTVVQNGRGTWQPFGDASKANTLSQYKLPPDISKYELSQWLFTLSLHYANANVANANHTVED